MTCGRRACQRARHAAACRRWHERNPEVAASHYQDVVVPFRQRHPGYQRRRRLVERFREIRDEMAYLVGATRERLEPLVKRGVEAIGRAAQEPAQVRATAGQPLGVAVSVAASLGGLLEQLGASLLALGALGQTRRRDEIREEMGREAAS